MDLISYSNIGSARTEGVELEYIQTFDFLPDPLEGLEQVQAYFDIKTSPIPICNSPRPTTGISPCRMNSMTRIICSG